jgi:hypothetical protein
MSIDVSKRFTLIIFSIVMGCLIGCATNSNQQHDLTYLLQTSFENIYLAKFGLNYPGTKRSLNRCIQYNDRSCLASYQQVLDGKSTIESLVDRNALVTTLDIIERTCLSNNERISNFVCYGGIMSLYFYNTPEQDAIILKRLKNYPKIVKNIIFNNDYYWYRNRPDKNVWISTISKMDIDWKHEVQKQHLTELFNKSINDDDAEPWVLR